MLYRKIRTHIRTTTTQQAVCVCAAHSQIQQLKQSYLYLSRDWERWKGDTPLLIKYRDKTVEVVSVQCPQCTHTACCVVVVLCCVLWAYLCHPRPACFPLLSFPKFPNKIRLLLSHALLHNNNVKDSFTFRPRRLGPKVQLQSSTGSLSSYT